MLCKADGVWSHESCRENTENFLRGSATHNKDYLLRNSYLLSKRDPIQKE